MVDDFLATLQVSCFVAMYFANYDKLPCIGKVLAVEEDNFKVHYWKGTYYGKWTPQHVPDKNLDHGWRSFLRAV